MLKPFRTLQQAAALPFVCMAEGPEVALITSRERRRWIVPKGWPEKGLSLAETAALEALDEAGIEGDMAQEPIGSFVYDKKLDKGYSVPCRVFVFPLLARVQRMNWKEKAQREVRWCQLAEAARRADDRGLAKLLMGLAKNPGKLSSSAADHYRTDSR